VQHRSRTRTATNSFQARSPSGHAILAQLAAGFRTISLAWADGGYANSVDSALLSWARDALDIVVEIVKRTDDVRASRSCPAAGWWSEVSAGWSETVGWPATTNG